MTDEIQRETMEVDVLFVGGGPANLAGAIHLAKLIAKHNETADRKLEPEILLLEKAANLGNHNLSGAVMNPVAFRELFGADAEPPGGQAVTKDGFMFLTAARRMRLWPIPPSLSNHGNIIISISKLVRWMAEQAEATGTINIFPGFAASELLMEDGRVVGVQTRDTGIDKTGGRRANFEPGMNLKAKVTVLGEGTRGTLTRQLEKRTDMQDGRDPQSYALGVKEVWKVAPEKHEPGLVWHTLGWPLSQKRQVGGGWVYHMADGLVSIGLVTRLDYDDPMLDPFDEFQRQKTHPWIADLLEGAELQEYGAKSIPEGGFRSIPKLWQPGCLVTGDSGGLINGFKLKGIHYAIKSGMLAAETIFAGLVAEAFDDELLAGYQQQVMDSYIGRELYRVRNFHAALTGNLVASMFRISVLIATFGNLLLGSRHTKPDWKHMRDKSKSIVGALPSESVLLPKDPIVHNRATALYHSGTEHEENQPSHLVVGDLDMCVEKCWPEFGAPCQRFCPAEVYEMQVDDAGTPQGLLVHAANCVHCKTCDIKDPYENILWQVPEATGGPRYKLT